MSLCWLDGEWRDTDATEIGCFNHSLHYGCAVFEGLRAYPIGQRAGIFRLNEHIARFFDSATLIGMDLNRSPGDIARAVCELVQRSGIADAYIRPIAYHGNGLAGLTTQGITTHVALLIWKWDNAINLPLLQRAKRLLISDYRRPDSRFTVPQAKVSGNYLNSRLAYLRAKQRGFDDAVLMDADGFISECSAQNIFLVKDRLVRTPRLKSCLAGITRESIIRLATHAGLNVQEDDIRPEELLRADEAFVTSTAGELTPVTHVDGTALNGGQVGEISSMLYAQYRGAVRGEHAQANEWVTLV